LTMKPKAYNILISCIIITKTNVGCMMKTYSYVIDHDCGYAPNPQKGICTLVQCKFQGPSRNRNIVELSNVSDIIIGTGGSSKCSTGHGTLIYIMKVTQKISFEDYLITKRYQGRVDCHNKCAGNKYALISMEFIYFGEEAVGINSLPQQYRNIEKKGPWFRVLVPESIGDDLYAFLKKRYGIGMKGKPTCNEFDMHPTRQCIRPAIPVADC
jgi:hypothetical protein